MLERLFLKSEFRRVWITLATLLLIGVASFLFCEKLFELRLADEEIEQAHYFYRAVGDIYWEKEEKNDIDLDKITEYLKGNPYVQTVNCFSEVSGVMDGVNNVDYRYSVSDEYYPKGFPSNNDIVFVGKYVRFKKDRNRYWFEFEVENAISGYDEYFAPNKPIVMYVERGGALAAKFIPGESYLLRGHYDSSKEKGHMFLYSSEYQDFTLFTMKALFEDGPMYANADEAMSMLSEGKLHDDVLLMAENRKSVDVFMYEDVSAMRELQGNSHYFILDDGRWPQDTEEVPVCAISRQFSEEREIRLGDVLRINLRNMPGSSITYGMYCGESDYGKYEQIQKEAVEFTVVGIYGENAEYSSYNNVIFASTVNIKSFDLSLSLPIYIYGHYWATFDGGETTVTDNTGLRNVAGTFILKNIDDLERFEEYSATDLAALKVKTSYYENGYSQFKQMADRAHNNNVSNVRIFGALLIGLYLVAGIIFSFSLRREIGLLRVFGEKKQKIFEAFLTPIAILEIVANGIGSGFALKQALAEHKNVVDNAADSVVMTHGEMVGFVLITTLVLTAFAVSVFACCAARYFIMPITKNLKSSGKERYTNASKKVKEKTVPLEGRNLSPTATRFRAFVRFVILNLFRSTDGYLWMALMISLCLIGNTFISAVLQMQNENLDNLYNSIVVSADINKKDNAVISSGADRGFVSGKTIRRIQDTSYFENLYYIAVDETNAVLEVDPETGYTIPREDDENSLSRKYTVEAPNDFDRYIIENDYIEIEWKEGWNKELFTQNADEYPILVSKTYVDRLISSETKELVFRYPDKNLIKVERYVIAGVYESLMGGFVVPVQALEKVRGEELMHYKFSFTVNPVLNKNLEEIKLQAISLLDDSESAIIVFWDEELTKGVSHVSRIVKVLERLYPITYAAALVIIIVISCLLAGLRKREGLLLVALNFTAGFGRLAAYVETVIAILLGLIPGTVISVVLVSAQTGCGSDVVLNSAIMAVLYLILAMISAAITVFITVNKSGIAKLKAKE